MEREPREEGRGGMGVGKVDVDTRYSRNSYLLTNKERNGCGSLSGEAEQCARDRGERGTEPRGTCRGING